MYNKSPAGIIAAVILLASFSCAKSSQPPKPPVTITIPDSVTLYTGTVPNSTTAANAEYYTVDSIGVKRYYAVSIPKMYTFRPSKEVSSGTSVIICPGGSYTHETYTTEGSVIAQQFALNGITAFVLKYRIPSDLTMVDKSIGPLQDAQRAIQIIRQNATSWGLNPNNVGIMGFSAGGHLASTAATHFKTSYIPNPDNISLKPSFQCLISSVISMTDSLENVISRNQLLGLKPSQDLILQFSNELQVTAGTSPGFFVHAQDDLTSNVKNIIYYDNALKKFNIPEQLYLYPTGGHNIGLTNPTSPVKWFDIMMPWLESHGFVVK